MKEGGRRAIEKTPLWEPEGGRDSHSTGQAGEGEGYPEGRGPSPRSSLASEGTVVSTGTQLEQEMGPRTKEASWNQGH